MTVTQSYGIKEVYQRYIYTAMAVSRVAGIKRLTSTIINLWGGGMF